MTDEKKPNRKWSKTAKKMWQEITNTFELECYHFHLLEKALDCHTKYEEYEKIVAQDGPVITNERTGTIGQHPLLKAMNDLRTSYLRFMKSLNLDLEIPSNKMGRPPGR